MNDAAVEVLDRLRNVRSLPWLRAIDAADLDGALEPEPDPETVVAPYRWLLRRATRGRCSGGSG